MTAPNLLITLYTNPPLCLVLNESMCHNVAYQDLYTLFGNKTTSNPIYLLIY